MKRPIMKWVTRENLRTFVLPETTVVIVPIVAIVMVLYSMSFASTTLDRDRLNTSVAIELKARVAMTHAAVEGFVGGDKEADLYKTVYDNMDEAALLCGTMRDGGQTRFGLVHPIRDPIGMKNVRTLCDRLREFHQLIGDRLTAHGIVSLEAELEKANDQMFHEIIQRTDAVVDMMHRIAARNRRMLDSVDLGIVLLLGGFLVGMIVSVRRDLAERRRSGVALQDANEKLAAQVDELAQRAREIHLLTEMGNLFEACTTAEEAYQIISQFAGRLFPDESGGLYVISPSRDTVESVATWGRSLASEEVFAPEDCWALRRGQVHTVESPQTEVRCRHLPDQLMEAYVCIPLMAQGETLGLMHLQSHGRVGWLTPSKRRIAMAAGEHIAMALSNLRLRETLQRQSIRDPLTGLFNRRYMEETLGRDLRRAARKAVPVGVIMFDIDHFKNINDTFGHDAGDTLLRELGNFLTTQFRQEDIVCRTGGEEFTVILPECSVEQTRNRAEHLRQEVKHLAVQHRGTPLGQIAISLGVAAFPEHGLTANALLEVVDAAAYKAKAEGRDRVVTATAVLSFV